ncbi:MAG: hypothetical protein F4Z19_13885 [Holophagales bacterium]|nr:hypothetical protein [Holophagales bacterium]
MTDQNTLTLPGRWETGGAVMASLIEMTRFLPDDYWDTFADAVRGGGLSDCQRPGGPGAPAGQPGLDRRR